ncbi:hypothetical protein Bbelb_364780 [Branchiostoma belcheri]|nr:hypothetical protein Bbelb_364780 [Branchiostoma belcheri]
MPHHIDTSSEGRFCREKFSPPFGAFTTSLPAKFLGGKTVPPRQNSRVRPTSLRRTLPRDKLCDVYYPSNRAPGKRAHARCHMPTVHLLREGREIAQCEGEVITIMDACPEVYTTPPVQPKEKKPGQLTNEQVKRYFDEGFVLVKDFFTPEELQPCRDGTAELVDALAERLYKAGKIKNTYRDAGLFQRLTLIEEEFPGTCALLLKEGKIHKAYCDLWVNDRLLNVMEQLVGPEIAGNLLWNLRPKVMMTMLIATSNIVPIDPVPTQVPSNDETTVPWHQDNCYTLPESLGTLIPVAWIPLLDATVENGCMQVVAKKIFGHINGYVNRAKTLQAEQAMGGFTCSTGDVTPPKEPGRSSVAAKGREPRGSSREGGRHPPSVDPGQGRTPDSRLTLPADPGATWLRLEAETLLLQAPLHEVARMDEDIDSTSHKNQRKVVADGVLKYAVRGLPGKEQQGSLFELLDCLVVICSPEISTDEIANLQPKLPPYYHDASAASRLHVSEEVWAGPSYVDIFDLSQFLSWIGKLPEAQKASGCNDIQKGPILLDIESLERTERTIGTAYELLDSLPSSETGTSDNEEKIDIPQHNEGAHINDNISELQDCCRRCEPAPPSPCY